MPEELKMERKGFLILRWEEWLLDLFGNKSLRKDTPALYYSQEDITNQSLYDELPRW